MRKILWLLGALVLLWVGLGPLPVDNSDYRSSDYYKTTLDSLAKAPMLKAEGRLLIGLAETDISPKIGQPLAGYGGRKPMAAEGIESPCYARALTLSVNGQAVTLLTGDMLLATDDLVDAVLQRTGLPRRQLYFTSTHTHSGPGGYGKRILEKFAFGDYEQAYFDRMAEKLADVVTRSRRDLKQAEFAVVGKEVPGVQFNRIDRNTPTHDRIQMLMFRAVDGPDSRPPLALLSVFGAHATMLGSGNHRVSPDYPGYLMAKLKRRTGVGMAMFAAGSVGDAGPVRPKGKDSFERARIYGERLADELIEVMPQAHYQQKVSLASLSIPVQLPKRRISVGSDWTLGPLLTPLVGDRQGRLTLLRIGPCLLAGFPGDYAGHLATQLEQKAKQTLGPSVVTITTSFSGGYEGYLVSHYWHRERDTYETRMMNFFGPWFGEYMNELSLRMAKRLFTGTEE